MPFIPLEGTEQVLILWFAQRSIFIAPAFWNGCATMPSLAEVILVSLPAEIILVGVNNVNNRFALHFPIPVSSHSLVAACLSHPLQT
jgi:hypothetical protein